MEQTEGYNLVTLHAVISRECGMSLTQSQIFNLYTELEHNSCEISTNQPEQCKCKHLVSRKWNFLAKMSLFESVQRLWSTKHVSKNIMHLV